MFFLRRGALVHHKPPVHEMMPTGVGLRNWHLEIENAACVDWQGMVSHDYQWQAVGHHGLGGEFGHI